MLYLCNYDAENFLKETSMIHISLLLLEYHLLIIMHNSMRTTSQLRVMRNLIRMKGYRTLMTTSQLMRVLRNLIRMKGYRTLMTTSQLMRVIRNLIRMKGYRTLMKHIMCLHLIIL